MINIFINIKSIGKRKSALQAMPYSLPDNIANLSGLITAVVNIEVDRYNSRETEVMLLPFLTEAQIADQSVTGKVGFGHLYAEKSPNPEKAVAIALQGFEDGLFRVMINDMEIKELAAPVNLKDGDRLTFIRLTFLTGRLW
ncbi:hypothetical protein [Sporomusa sphaeroides]|uniref:hypothetical protein n=1 Tax=Sporomusa sphaeroides TaxID=47679 RepID=UPI0031586CCC